MAQFVVERGPAAGRSWPLEGESITIGRDRSNDVWLHDDTVSRAHARVEFDGTIWSAADLGSRNGTRVNGERVTRAPLSHMDRLQLGDVVLVFVDAPALLEDDAAPPEITQVLPSSRVEMLSLDERGRSPEELAEVNRGLVQLFTLSRDVQACGSLPELMSRVSEAAGEALAADRVVPITVDESGGLRPWFGRPSGPAPGLADLPISATVVNHVRSSGDAVVSEVARDERFSDRPSIVRNEIATAMCVPLAAGGEELGLIYADRIAPAEPFTRADLEMLAALAMPVVVAIENLRAAQRLKTERERLVDQIKLEHNLIGEHESIVEVLRLIERVAPADSSVLVIGESGTGKELVARAIHYNSPRQGEAFEAVNCAAMAPALLESELFGHVKGAFTGAVADKPGRFELADNGTLFLDEVGELPLESQAKLLRVIEQGELRRVGDTRDRRVDVRIIAATNQPLDAMVADKEFRDDLFYRLNIVRIELPLLRARGDDVDLLADHFLRFFSAKCGREPPEISARARQLLRKYAWPGNVRELKNVMERLAVLCRGDEVRPGDLPPEVRAGRSPAAGDTDATASLADIEREHIIRVLAHTGGNKKEAAGVLGIDRSTLYSKLKQYEIE
ncbi:MAG: sigma 54-interacting transcriptional regulator [bacterium]